MTINLSSYLIPDLSTYFFYAVFLPVALFILISRFNLIKPPEFARSEIICLSLIVLILTADFLAGIDYSGLAATAVNYIGQLLAKNDYISLLFTPFFAVFLLYVYFDSFILFPYRLIYNKLEDHTYREMLDRSLPSLILSYILIEGYCAVYWLSEGIKGEYSLIALIPAAFSYVALIKVY